tara:strand:- start:47 stop:6322 length:6276 start_codon:yes stop_codon:yes gene_type:complete
MFEFNGNLFSMQEVTATATELGLSLDEYLQKNPQVKRKQSEDFQNPAVQGATTGETQAPLTASELEGGLSVSQGLENRDTVKRKALFKSMGAVPGNSAFGVLPDWAQEKMYNATIGTGEILGGVVDFFDGMLSPVVAATGPAGAIDLMTTISLADNIDEGLGNWARKHGNKIDLEPLYENLNKAKDLSVKKYDNKGNILDVDDLIQEGRIGDAADLAASQAAFSAPSLALAIASPLYGGALLGASTSGNDLRENLKNRPGATASQLYGSALIKGGSEWGTEYLGGKFFSKLGKIKNLKLGKGPKKKAIEDFTRGFFGQTGKVIAAGVGGFMAEGSTEALNSLVQDFSDELLFDEDPNYIKNMVNSFVIGGFLGGPVNSTGSVITQFKTSQNKENLYEFVAPAAWKKKQGQIDMQIVNAKDDLSRATTKKKKQFFENKIKNLESKANKNKSTLFETFDNLTNTELVQYGENLDAVRDLQGDLRSDKYSKLHQEEVKKEIEQRYQQNADIIELDKKDASIEKVISEALIDTEIVMDKVSKLKGINKEDLDITYVTADNRPGDMKDAAGMFLDESGSKPKIFIDLKNVAEAESTNVLGHELLHYVMSRAFKVDNASMAPLVESFKEYLNKSEQGTEILGRIEKRINNNYKNKKTGKLEDGALEEYFNIFSDIISKEKVNLDDGKIDGIKRAFKNTFDNIIGKSKIELNTGKDIVDFIKNFNTNVNKKNKLLNYEITTSKDGVEVVDKKQTIKKKSVSTASMSNTLDSYITEEIKTQDDFKKNDKAVSGVYKEIEGNQILDGYLSNLIAADKNLGGLPKEIQSEALRKIRERITDRVLKNYKPTIDGDKRSLFSYIYGSNKGKGTSGIAYKSLLDVKEQYVKAIKTTSIEKQVGGTTTTIQVIDTDSQSIEDMVDQSLLQTEESIPKSKLKENTSIVTPELVQEIFDVTYETIISDEVSIDDKKFRNFLIKSYGSNLYKKIKVEMKDFDAFLDKEYSGILNHMPIQFFIQAEKLVPADQKIFTKYNRRLTKQADIRKARDEGRTFVENEAQGVDLYDRLKPTEKEFKEFWKVRGRKDALAKGLAVQLGFDMTPTAIEIVGLNTNEQATVVRKIERVLGQKFSKSEKKKQLDGLLNSEGFFEIVSNFSKNAIDVTDAIQNFITKAGILKKKYPSFDPTAFMKNKKGQAAELFLSQELEKILPGLKVLNKKDLQQLKTGDTGVDVELEYKGVTFGIEVKMKTSDRTGSFIILDTSILPQGAVNKLNTYSSEIKNNIIQDLKRIGFKENEILIGETTIKFPDKINNKKVIDGKKSTLFKVVRSKSEIIKDNGQIVREFYIKKGEKKGVPVDYMLFMDSSEIVSLNNDSAKFGSPDISEMGFDSSATVVWKSTSSKNGTRTLTRTIELGLVGKAKGKGANYKTLKSKLSKSNKKKSLDVEFNDILENSTKIESRKRYGKSKAQIVGKDKGQYDMLGIPPSAQDFEGLTRYFVGKGKKGNEHLAWIKENLLDPFAQGNVAISKARIIIAEKYNDIKKISEIAPKDLKKKIPGEPYSVSDALRTYIWNKQGQQVPGLSVADNKTLNKYINSNEKLKKFADELAAINTEGYPSPDKNWLVGTITTDLLQGLNTTSRKEALSKWQTNVDQIFSEENLNKLEAAYGNGYRSALENIIARMKTGRNKSYGGDPLTARFVDWLNGSVGAIMFFNMRSAVLQTISSVNFINWNDNNPLMAAKAFANQPQYWKDVMEIMNSDYLVERRNGLKINVNEADIAEIAAESDNKAKAFVNKLLKLGFLPTQIADSFAIASGGAAFYRNRINSYTKDGMSKKDASEKAFLDFREIAEENQQSSRPDRISKQQAGPLGRIILAFANTPAQYARIIQRAASDLKNGRGDAKSNVSKIIYYGMIQNVIFNALQQALFALSFGDEAEDEKEKEKYGNIANGMADSLLRGIGFHGAAISTLKNVLLKIADGKPMQDAALEVINLSPPVSSKIKKLKSAGRTFDWNKKEIKEKGFALDNPAYLAIGQLTSAFTNIPLDRGIKKITNIKDALDTENDEWMRVANVLGWQKWELEWKKDKRKNKSKKSTGFKSSKGFRIKK